LPPGDASAHPFQSSSRRFDATVRQNDAPLHRFDAITRQIHPTSHQFDAIILHFDPISHQNDANFHQNDATMVLRDATVVQKDATLHQKGAAMQGWHYDPQGKSGGGPPQSKTQSVCQRHANRAKRLGLRQSSGALIGADAKRLNSSRICNPASGVNKFSTVGAACL